MNLKSPKTKILLKKANRRELEVLTIGDLNDAEYDFVKKEWYPEKEKEKEEVFPRYGERAIDREEKAR